MMWFVKQNGLSAKLQRRIKSILFVFPSNIGDVVMSLPAVDYVKSVFPSARVYAVASPQTKDLLLHVTSIDAVLEYKKSWDWRKKLFFSLSLQNKYQAVFDFKNSALPLFARPLLRTPFIRMPPESVIHKKDFYLHLAQQTLGFIKGRDTVRPATSVLEKERRAYWDAFFHTLNRNKVIFLAYASNAEKKNYPIEHFAAICQALQKDFPILLISRKEDRSLGQRLYDSLQQPAQVWDMTGKTYLWELLYLLRKYACLVIGNDSGIIHIASYADVPTLGIFGPTPVEVYGPWAGRSHVVLPVERCPECQETRCEHIPARCLTTIKPEEIIEAARRMLDEGCSKRG